ncbi:MAG: glycosyltransferase 87 family protein [Vicinamibacterales bacterium]
MRRHLVLAAGLLLAWLIIEGVFRHNLGYEARLVTDNYERGFSAERGRWAIGWRVPYRDVFSEFPQVATYVHGLPYIFVGDDKTAYISAFSLMMCGWLGATITLLRALRPAQPSFEYFLLFPPIFYFAYNRFDLIASVFLLLAFWCLKEQRHAAAGACLAAATLTKWYPGLVLPVLLSYTFRTTRRFDWPLVVAFGVTVAVLLAPIFVLAGPKAVLQPYLYHASRGLEMVSLPALAHEGIRQWLGVEMNPRIVQLACLAMLLATVIASLVARVESLENVIRWSFVLVGTSVLVSQVWSPQWILWVMPLAILVAAPSDVPWLIAYALLNYVSFPLLYDTIGRDTVAVVVISLVVYAILFRTLISIGQRAWSTGFSLRLSPDSAP